jgi:hypothetical protein
VNTLLRFARFWYDFIVGDDWIVAAGIAVALALTALAAHHDVTSWWLMPTSVTLLLISSIWRGARKK